MKIREESLLHTCQWSIFFRKLPAYDRKRFSLEFHEGLLYSILKFSLNLLTIIYLTLAECLALTPNVPYLKVLMWL